MSKPNFETTAGFRPSQLCKMFRLEVTAVALNKAEAAGRIPQALRSSVGKGILAARFWALKDLPAIGKVFGKMPAPPRPVVVASYCCKGGIGKSLWSFNLSRIAALHGIRVLAIGTDFQCSLSKNFGIDYSSEKRPMSLYDVIKDNVSLSEIITSTDLPNLDFVPESTELTLLERHMVMMNRREETMTRLLKSVKSNYDLIVIDCGPSWQEITTAVLSAADAIISPINADAESYHSFGIFIEELQRFMTSSEKSFELIKFIPNMVNLGNRFTTAFQRKFLDEYPEVFTTSFLRETVVFKEATSMRRSIIEHAPTTGAADDLFGAIHEVWGELLARLSGE